MDRSWRGCCLLEEEEGEEEWRHGCWRRRAGKGPALEEADDAGEDEQPEQAGASSRRSWLGHPWLLAEQRHRPWGLLAAMEQKGHWGGDELGGPKALARWRRWLPAAAASQEEQGGRRAIAGRGKGRGATKGVAPWEEGSRAPCALGKKAPCSAWGKKPGREESGG
jgi:hypothetical protein